MLESELWTFGNNNNHALLGPKAVYANTAAISCASAAGLAAGKCGSRNFPGAAKHVKTEEYAQQLADGNHVADGRGRELDGHNRMGGHRPTSDERRRGKKTTCLENGEDHSNKMGNNKNASGVEIPFWLFGQQKWVSGISQRTTCHEIVKALFRHLTTLSVEPVTGQTASGQLEPAHFQLVEKWRKIEKPLDGGQRILTVWEAWGADKTEVKLVVKKKPTLGSSAGGMGANRWSSLTATLAGGQDHLNTEDDTDSEVMRSAGRHRRRHVPHKVGRIRKLDTVHPRKSHDDKEVSKETIQDLMKIIINQGNTIQSQLEGLKQRDRDIENIEEKMHNIRMKESGKDYVLKTYLDQLPDQLPSTAGQLQVSPRSRRSSQPAEKAPTRSSRLFLSENQDPSRADPMGIASNQVKDVNKYLEKLYLVNLDLVKTEEEIVRLSKKKKRKGKEPTKELSQDTIQELESILRLPLAALERELIQSRAELASLSQASENTTKEVRKLEMDITAIEERKVAGDIYISNLESDLSTAESEEKELRSELQLIDSLPPSAFATREMFEWLRQTALMTSQGGIEKESSVDDFGQQNLGPKGGKYLQGLHKQQPSMIWPSSTIAKPGQAGGGNSCWPTAWESDSELGLEINPSPPPSSPAVSQLRLAAAKHHQLFDGDSQNSCRYEKELWQATSTSHAGCGSQAPVAWLGSTNPFASSTNNHILLPDQVHSPGLQQEQMQAVANSQQLQLSLFNNGDCQCSNSNTSTDSGNNSGEGHQLASTTSGGSGPSPTSSSWSGLLSPASVSSSSCHHHHHYHHQHHHPSHHHHDHQQTRSQSTDSSSADSGLGAHDVLPALTAQSNLTLSTSNLLMTATGSTSADLNAQTPQLNTSGRGIPQRRLSRYLTEGEDSADPTSHTRGRTNNADADLPALPPKRPVTGKLIQLQSPIKASKPPQKLPPAANNGQQPHAGSQVSNHAMPKFDQFQHHQQHKQPEGLSANIKDDLSGENCRFYAQPHFAGNDEDEDADSDTGLSSLNSSTCGGGNADSDRQQQVVGTLV